MPSFVALTVEIVADSQEHADAIASTLATGVRSNARDARVSVTARAVSS